jgi:lipoteichoic acid synthase
MVLTKDMLRASLARIRSISGGRDWTYLLALLVPLAVYNLVLKAIRIHTREEHAGILEVLGLIRSDVFFNLGYALLWIGLFALAKRGLLRWMVVILFHATAVLVVAITTCAHLYFEETGSTLDLNIIVYSLTTFGEIKDVVASVGSAATWVLVGVALCYMVLGPSLVTWLVGRWRRWRNRRELSGRPTTVSWKGATAVGLAGVVIALFSVPVESSGASISFSRDPVVNVIASQVEYERLKQIAADANVSPKQPPVDTRLKPTARIEKRNVVLIHLESVRSRSATPYNEDLKTMPFLDELAQRSLVAERAYAVVPHTSKALVSVNCSIEPRLVRDITEAEPDGVPARCLADLLKEEGYDTVWFSSATKDFEDRPDLVRNLGYDEFYPVESMDKEGFQRSNYFGYEDDIMLQPSKAWLEEHKDKPFLATYLGVTGHHDYRPIDRYGSKDFAQADALNRYQNEVRYLDFFVKNVIEQYKQMGLYDNTIFVIYGDHGEGFGEHELKQHDNTIYEEGIRIPLIVHVPSLFRGGERVETLTNQQDILPTVSDLLGYKVEGGEYPGRSMLAPPDENRKLFFSCFDDYRCLASLKGDQKYIYFFGNQLEEAYDLSSDPSESNNLADERSDEELKRRRTDVLAWYSRVNAMYEKRKPRQQRVHGSNR